MCYRVSLSDGERRRGRKIIWHFLVLVCRRQFVGVMVGVLDVNHS